MASWDGRIVRAYPLGRPTDRAATSSAPVVVRHPLIDGRRIVDVAAGRDHTAVLVEDGDGARSVITLGSNKRGQLGAADRTARDGSISAAVLDALADDGRSRALIAVHATWTTTLITARVEGGEYEVWTCGSLGPADEDATTALRRLELPPCSDQPIIAAGSEHVLALLADADGRAEVHAWGWNEHGNLGLGHLEDVATPTRLTDLPGRPVAVAAGNATSWVAVASA